MEEEQTQEIELRYRSAHPDSMPVSRGEFLGELKSFRSDVRLLILGSVALNQFLANISIPTAFTAAVAVAWVGKVVISAISLGRG